MKIKGILLNPRETFREVQTEGIGESIKQVAVIALIPAIITTIFAVLSFNVLISPFIPVNNTYGFSAMLMVFTFIGVYIFTVLGLLICSLFFHIIVYLFGGREGIEQTIKTVMYSSTPLLILGWIPIIGILAGIWSLILEYMGLRELQKMSSGRAAGTIIVAIIIVIAIVYLTSYMILSSPLSSTYSLTSPTVSF